MPKGLRAGIDPNGIDVEGALNRIKPDLSFQATQRGMLVPGNIDLNNRPVINNADGSQSTEYSTSFGLPNGSEVLVPSIANGKFLTPSGQKPPEGSQAEKNMLGYRDASGVFHKGAAQQYYEQTKQHMGIFDTPENADVYANKVHNRPIRGLRK